MFRPKILRSDVLNAIDRIMVSYESELVSDIGNDKRSECVGAIEALEKLKRELDMHMMISEYRRSLK